MKRGVAVMKDSVERDFKFPLRAMLKFCETNPSIKDDGISYYRSVFYPIAKLQLELEELNYEEFEYINYCILKLFSSGLKSESLISEFTGLPLSFIQNILYDLEGSGQINRTQGLLTAMGKESVSAEQKITKFKTMQTFQVDAVTGNLLKLDFSRSDTKLYNKNQTENYLAHIMHMDSLDLAAIREQLTGQDRIKDYKRYKADILNANVDQIISAECKEIKYMNAFIISLNRASDPFPVILTFSRKKDKSIERKWRPLFLPDSVARAYPDFVDGVPIISSLRLKEFNQFCDVLKDSINKDSADISASDKKVLLAEYFQFDPSHISVTDSRGNGLAYTKLRISKKSFSEVNRNVLSLFELIASNMEIPYNVRVKSKGKNERFCTINVLVSCDDNALVRVAQQYYAKNNRVSIANKLCETSWNVKGEALIEKIIQFLNSPLNDI